MGTHRSKHNKGRKPFYKDHRDTAMHLLAHPWAGEDFRGHYAMTRTWWKPLEIFKLEILCEADTAIEPSADVFGRRPETLAYKAREQGFALPSQWARLIAPKRKPRMVNPKQALLAYPYISTPRPEHADLLAINAIVPKGIPDHMRADICQEIMVAILEGRTTLDALRAQNKSGAYFIKKFWHDNYEQGGHAISFQDHDDDWDSDAVASSIAAKEWHQNQFAERTRYTDSIRTFSPPVQFEAAWHGQVERFRMTQRELGSFLTHEEAEQLFDVQI
jgi:hypothetical protein